MSLTSNWFSFHEEVDFLHKYFKDNFFPSDLFYRYTHKFLNKTFIPKIEIPTVPKMPLYASIPLIHDKKFYSELRKLASTYVPAVKLNLIPTNPFTIGSLFKIKDRLCPLMTSNVIYMFKCPKCNLGNYVGATQRLLKVRADSHKGVSYRTGTKLKNPEFSNIREHAQKCKYAIQYEDFNIVCKAKNSQLLTILEPLVIKPVVPNLNG